MSISILPVVPSIAPAVPMRVQHVLPGDQHAGLDLGACADAWSIGGPVAFVRLRVVSPLDAHIAVLRFDEAGYGTVISCRATPGHLPAQIEEAISDIDHVVLLSDCNGEGRALFGTRTIEHRDFLRTRIFEERELGLSRDDRDLDPQVWSAVRQGDILAERWLLRSASADLFALVCLAGANVTLH